MNQYQIKPIELQHIKEIMTWKYGPPYELYNLNDNEETKNQFIKAPYYVLLNEKNDLIGYYSHGIEATIPYGDVYKAYIETDYLDIGLGLNPKYTSKGFGEEFMKQGLDYFSNRFNTTKFRLTVLDNNIRGRKLYHKMGFKVLHTFPSNIGQCHFLVMVKD